MEDKRMPLERSGGWMRGETSDRQTDRQNRLRRLEATEAKRTGDDS